MPRSAVGIAHRVGHGRKSLVDLPPLLRDGPVVDRGADQGVAKSDARADRQDALILCRDRHAGAEVEVIRGSPEQIGITGGSAAASSSSRRVLPGNGVDSMPEAVLEASQDRSGTGDRESARHVGRPRGPGKLEQG